MSRIIRPGDHRRVRKLRNQASAIARHRDLAAARELFRGGRTDRWMTRNGIARKSAAAVDETALAIYRFTKELNTRALLLARSGDRRLHTRHYDAAASQMGLPPLCNPVKRRKRKTAEQREKRKRRQKQPQEEHENELQQ